jgi:uncharacterized Zn finger protein (UPF0148 family)
MMSLEKFQQRKNGKLWAICPTCSAKEPFMEISRKKNQRKMNTSEKFNSNLNRTQSRVGLDLQ